MTVRRPLVLLVVVLFLVGAVALERGDDDEAPRAPDRIERLAPTVAAPDAGAATWYCAAGTALASGDGAAEQVVVLANATDEPRTALLTAMGEGEESGTTTVDVPPNARTQVAVSDVLAAPWASVLVEVDGGGVGVDHVLSGPTGVTAGPCASTVSSSWYLPAGTTALGVGHWLAIFNPFTDEAVVDLTFETDTDTREPPALQGLVIPGRSVEVVDVAAVVTVRDQLATSVVARSGLVVVEQVEAISDDAESLPTSLSATLGAPALADTWELAEGRPLVDGVDVQVVVYNPGEQPAEVDVQLLVDDPATNGFIEPYQLTVRPGKYAIVDLGEDGRLPTGLGFWAWVESRNEVGVVAGMVVRAVGDAEPSGQVLSLGSPVVGTAWLVPYGGVAGGAGANLSVANPGAAEVTVTVSAVVDGASTPVEGLIDIPIDPSGRVVLELGDAVDPAALALRVDATGPVAVARTVVFLDDRGVATAPALPFDGTISRPAPFVSDELTTPTVVLDGEVPADGSAPAGGDGDGEATTTTAAADATTTTADATTTTAAADGSTTTTTAATSTTAADDGTG